MNEDLVSAAEAARLLSVAESTVYRYEKRGRLVPVRIDREGLRRRPQYRRSDVLALLPQDTAAAPTNM